VHGNIPNFPRLKVLFILKLKGETSISRSGRCPESTGASANWSSKLISTKRDKDRSTTKFGNSKMQRSPYQRNFGVHIGYYLKALHQLRAASSSLDDRKEEKIHSSLERLHRSALKWYPKSRRDSSDRASNNFPFDSPNTACHPTIRRFSEPYQKSLSSFCFKET
jgi:hypothetical protein